MEAFWRFNDLYCCSLISFHFISVILQRHFSKFFFLINLVSRNASFTSCSSFIFHWFSFLISFWFVWPPLVHCCSTCFLGARDVRIRCLSEGSVRGLINDCCPKSHRLNCNTYSASLERRLTNCVPPRPENICCDWSFNLPAIIETSSYPYHLLKDLY